MDKNIDKLKKLFLIPSNFPSWQNKFTVNFWFLTWTNYSHARSSTAIAYIQLSLLKTLTSTVASPASSYSSGELWPLELRRVSVQIYSANTPPRETKTLLLTSAISTLRFISTLHSNQTLIPFLLQPLHFTSLFCRYLRNYCGSFLFKLVP
jgi:hypothetical protein